MIGQKNPSPYKNMTMQHMVASKLRTNPAGINENVAATLSPAESQRNFAIQRNLSMKTFRPFLEKTHVQLPKDNDQSQAARSAEFQRQLVMPWQSVFMRTATDAQRLNNVSQQSFIKQRRLSVPNSYGQFYAFMHALSAAFGTLQQGS